jgi:hypothetical protein
MYVYINANLTCRTQCGVYVLKCSLSGIPSLYWCPIVVYRASVMAQKQISTHGCRDV